MAVGPYVSLLLSDRNDNNEAGLVLNIDLPSDLYSNID